MKRGLIIGLLVTAALPGCAAKQPKVALGVGTALPGQSADIVKAVALLEKGETKKAREKLSAILKSRPGDAAARKLIAQIDGDPKAMLGTSSFPHLARPGDTYQSLAQRYLGDPLMFYALARYNGVAVPTGLSVGSTLRIPGTNHAAETRTIVPKPRQPTKSLAKTVAPVAEKPATPTALKADAPALAGALRKQAFSALAKGNPRGAVVLLERAAAADPGSKLVAADLARAKRVRDAVR